MSAKMFRHPPIVKGFPWRLRLTATATPALFPEGVALISQVRQAKGDSTVLHTFRTDDESLVRIDDDTIDIVLACEVTVNWTARSVTFDLVRTDTTEPQFLGITVTVPVMSSVTSASAT